MTRRWIGVITGIALVAGLSYSGTYLLAPAGADDFGPQNFVVYRVGDGVADLTNAATPVSFVEYATDGTKVQTIALPTTSVGSQHALTAAGLSTSEGFLQRSEDARFLTATGYDAAVGTTGPAGTSLTATSPSTVARTVAVIDGTGAVDTTTALTGSNVPYIVRSAATSDGSRLWVAGGNGGVLTATKGSSSATTISGEGSANIYQVGTFASQLLAGGPAVSVGTDPRLRLVGSGLPTSAAALSGISGLPAGALVHGFAAFDLTDQGDGSTGLDTIYIVNGADRGGAVAKYTFSAGEWRSAGSIELPGAFGLAAQSDGSKVSVLITTRRAVYAFNDTNPTANNVSSFSVPSQIVTADAKTEFRGIALAPQPSTGPSITITAPAINTTIQTWDTELVVSATAEDADGVKGVTIKLDSGTPVNATLSQGIWTATLPLSSPVPGAHTITVTATDNAIAQNVNTATRDVTVASVSGPSVAFTSPTAGALIEPHITTLPVSVTVSDPQGVKSVQIRIGSKAYVTATQGSGSTWLANLPLSGVTAGLQTLTILATDNSPLLSTSTATRNVTKVAIVVPAGAIAPNTTVKAVDVTIAATGFTKYTYASNAVNKGLRALGNATATFKFVGRTLNVNLAKGKDAGKVRITVDGTPRVVDLYSGATANWTETFSVTYGTHSVEIKALGSKNVKATSTWVRFGSVVVVL